MPRWPFKRRLTAEEFIAASAAAEHVEADALDAATIDALVQAGGDLSQSTHVIHFLYLPTAEAAEACRREFEDEGFEVSVFEPDRDIPAFAVHAEHHIVVSHESIRAARERLTAGVTGHATAYDGWEAAVTR